MEAANNLRDELRTRNNVLWHAIFDCYDSVAGFCRQCGFDNVTVGALLNLAASPYAKKNGEPTKTAVRLADVLGMSIERLFPPDLYSGLIPQKMVAEIPSHVIPARTTGHKDAFWFR